MGRWLSGFVLYPFLCIDVILACFQTSGNTDSFSDCLKIRVRGCNKVFLHSLINFVCKLSGPCDLDGFSLSIAFSTRFSVFFNVR